MDLINLSRIHKEFCMMHLTPYVQHQPKKSKRGKAINEYD